MNMRLDVVIPTYNRSDLLMLAVQSLFAARVPAELKVRVIVIDNNSTDATADVVRELQMEYGSARLVYEREKIQGRAAALNRGILVADSELVGMVDDDEEVDASWYEVIYSIFSERPEVSFIGGPYLPAKQIQFPKWLPMSSYRGVIGWIQSGDSEYAFDGKNGILLGGNAVLKRSVFDKVGLYDVQLGRRKTRLMSMEDQDLFERLLATGEKGIYIPKLIIYHHITERRLTRRYHRRWCFWTGVSLGLRERSTPSKVPRILRMPRYRIRASIESGFRAITGPMRRAKPSGTFADELDVWVFAGMLVGLYFWRRRPSN